jgi:hypothetical protein
VTLVGFAATAGGSRFSLSLKLSLMRLKDISNFQSILQETLDRQIMPYVMNTGVVLREMP